MFRCRLCLHAVTLWSQIGLCTSTQEERGRAKRQDLSPISLFYSERNILSRTMESLRCHPINKLKLVCRGFMDAGRSHETPGSEIKDFISHSTSSGRSISIICHSSPCPQDPREQYRGARRNAFQERKLNLGNSNLAEWSVGKSDLCPGVKHYLCLPRFGEAVCLSSRIFCPATIFGKRM